MGWGVARLREHKLKLRNALARRARLDVCRDGVETLGHQLQSLLLKLGRAAVLSWGCGLHAKAILTATAVPPLLRGSAEAMVGRATCSAIPDGTL